MEEPIPAKEPLPARIWVPCLLITLLMFGMLTALRLELQPKIRLWYDELEMKDLPELTLAAMRVAPYLWIPALAATIRGYLLIRAGDRDRTFTWFLWTAVATLALHAAILYSFLFPLFKIQTVLSK